MEALKIFNQGFFDFKTRRIKMTNLIINKIHEKLIKISRIKDNINDCKPESKNIYKKEIKYLTDEIKLFLDELNKAVQQEAEPSDLMAIPEISCTEEGFVRIKIPFILRNSIVDFSKYSNVLSKYFSEFLGNDTDFPWEDNRVFIKYIYEKNIDEKYYANPMDLSMFWKLFFVNLPGNYKVSSGNFCDDETATEIYIVPRESYKAFQKKYLYNEMEDEKMK
jgi:hypothetical protein